MDITLAKLDLLRRQYEAANDSLSTGIIDAMMQLYISGRINVLFDDTTGQPVAEMIEYSQPLVAYPVFGGKPDSLFGQPVQADESTKRKIGFTVN